MPLNSTVLDIQVANPHYIRFPMEDGEKLVTVHIASGWLRERAERDQRNIADLTLLYHFYRDEIEAAASVKYDRNWVEGADVVIVASDLE